VSLDDERARINDQFRYLADGLTRVDSEIEELRRTLTEDVRRAVKEAAPEVILTAKEQRRILEFIDLEIERKQQSVRLRQALIEKGLTALMLMSVAGILAMIREYMISHGMWKP
jgi:hypothetical protein